MKDWLPPQRGRCLISTRFRWQGNCCRCRCNVNFEEANAAVSLRFPSEFLSECWMLNVCLSGWMRYTSHRASDGGAEKFPVYPSIHPSIRRIHRRGLVNARESHRKGNGFRLFPKYLCITDTGKHERIRDIDGQLMLAFTKLCLVGF